MILKQKLAMSLIKVGRKFFYNTPIQHWKFTSFVYDSVFHAGYTDKELSTTYFGAKLTFPARDFTITPGLVGGFYERFELELFESIVKQSHHLIDVGGNIGLYSIIAGLNGAVVDAFEPVPENQKYLSKNVIANDLTGKVTLHKKAVGAKKEKAQIYLSAKNIGTHSLSSHAVSALNSISVDVITLDDYFRDAKDIDLLKVDVEGYDGFVVEGGRKLIQKFKPTIFIELVPKNLAGAQYNPLDLVNVLYESYTKVFMVDELTEKVLEVSHETLVKHTTAGKATNIIAMSNQAHIKVMEKKVS